MPTESTRSAMLSPVLGRATGLIKTLGGAFMPTESTINAILSPALGRACNKQARVGVSARRARAAHVTGKGEPFFFSCKSLDLRSSILNIISKRNRGGFRSKIDDFLQNGNRGPTPEWVGWTVTGPSPAEGHLPWPGVLLVGELAQVPHYPER